MKRYQAIRKSLRGLKGYREINGKLAALVLCMVLLAGFLLPAMNPLLASATVNGNAWSAMDSGTTKELVSVWGNSSSDVFAVGEMGTILRYNGSAWSAMSSGTTNHLYGIWGTSPSDIFAVGDNGTILRYNGSTWNAMSSNTANNLYGIRGISSSDIFAVGGDGTILHYNGSAWSIMDTSSAGMNPGTDHSLFGIWGSSSSDVYALGYKNILLHYNGSAWISVGSPILYPGDIWGTSSSDVFIVGAFANIWHYDGSIWSEMSSGTAISPTASMLNGIWGSSSSDVFAVGANGTILHYQSTSAGAVTAAVASVPVPTGGLNEYALSINIVSTSDSRFSIGQQVWCAAKITDFPDLLTVGAMLNGKLDNSLGWWVLKAGTIISPPATVGTVAATVATVPVPTGGLNEYALSISVISTADSRFTIGQQVWCVAKITDFPSLLTVGATLTGTLDNSLGWWVFKKAASSGNTSGTVASTAWATGGANEYSFYLQITSSTVPGITADQWVWCAATTTDFPNLLTMGASLDGNLDNSFGWWRLSKAL